MDSEEEKEKEEKEKQIRMTIKIFITAINDNNQEYVNELIESISKQSYFNSKIIKEILDGINKQIILKNQKFKTNTKKE